jgi:hypothetical protein
MRALRLEERFDAISHMTTEADLLATLHTARAPLAPGGVALFCPDWTVECFAPGTSTGGIDGPERGMRYLEWTPPAIRGTTWEANFVYLLREADGSRRVVQDRMVLGIFPRATWKRRLTGAGLGNVAIDQQSGRDVFQAITARASVENPLSGCRPASSAGQACLPARHPGFIGIEPRRLLAATLERRVTGRPVSRPTCPGCMGPPSHSVIRTGFTGRMSRRISAETPLPHRDRPAETSSSQSSIFAVSTVRGRAPSSSTAA